MSRMLEIIDKEVDIENLCVKLKLYETAFKTLSTLIQSGAQTLTDINNGDFIKDGLLQDIWTGQQALTTRFQAYIDQINAYISSKGLSVSTLTLVTLNDLTASITAGQKLDYKLLQDIATNEKKLVENKENALNKLNEIYESIVNGNKILSTITIDYNIGSAWKLFVQNNGIEYEYPNIPSSIILNLGVGTHEFKTIRSYLSDYSMHTAIHYIQVIEIFGVKYFKYIPPINVTVIPNSGSSYIRASNSSDYLIVNAQQPASLTASTIQSLTLSLISNSYKR